MGNVHHEDRRVLVNAQSAQSVCSGSDLRKRDVHSQIPQSDFAVSTAGDQLSQTPSLHVHVGDPLLVIAPHFDHCRRRLHALVENSDGAVTESSHKDVACDLV
jgi:hypothetical protein